ncbi:MAG: glycerophosphodiester phosphodiesterase [Parcubacteria group bacterium]|nr:glycerophosphodiester phosphodiesterase [Parcubacteria group bacterium]MCR4342650.1 glycerophosphodiester phosphodiesterase [Patescibacteria group bacterium]
MNTKIIAHRGWSKGPDENTISAFKKAVASNMHGVEFDVRWSADNDKVIVSHDFTADDLTLTLKEALVYLEDKNLHIFIELKEYSDRLFDEILKLVESYGLKEKTVLFGFWKVASKFPFADRRGFKLGVISYPWNIRKDILRFDPDFVMMGYTSFLSKVAFRLYWRFFSLSSVFRKYPNKNFIIGVVRSEKEKEWISREEGLYALTADNPL